MNPVQPNCEGSPGGRLAIFLVEFRSLIGAVVIYTPPPPSIAAGSRPQSGAKLIEAYFKKRSFSLV
jgi:hypothetical protein